MAEIIPVRTQPSLPLSHFIVPDPPDAEAVTVDVLIVGAGPGGLAAAIELAHRAKAAGRQLSIAVLEKAASLGEHSLSGAVVNPIAFRELLPDTPLGELPFRGPVSREEVRFLTARGGFRIPTPPTMKNHGHYVASLCEIVRWLGERAGGLGVDLFTGFPAAALLVDGERVRGVRTTPSGLDRNGQPGSDYQPPTDLVARIVILAEGTRGPLAQAWRSWRGIGSPNPQIFALGVKEIWRVPQPLDRVIHTLGWPLPRDAFGGTFIYPMARDQIALGIVAGLDAPAADFDGHELLQRFKLHPFVRRLLAGGEMLEWGAKTIPEGGYWSLPERFSGDGLITVGDCAGFVDVASLKGIHYAMHSGMQAARAAFRALEADTVKAGPNGLGGFDRTIRESYIVSDLERTRNMRLVFKHGFFLAGLENALLTLTGGRFPGGRIAVHEDAEAPRRPGRGDALVPDGRLTFSKLDAVFKSGNATRDTIPSHLLAPDQAPRELAEFYAHLCPAGVYEATDAGLRINPPNCVDCKATDVLGPRWTPREGGSGPRYRMM